MVLRKWFAFPFHRWVCRFFGAVFAAAAVFNTFVPEAFYILEYADLVPLVPYCAAIAGFFLLQLIVTPFLKRFDYWLTAIAGLGYALQLMITGFDMSMMLATVLTIAILFVYLFTDDKLGIGNIHLGDRATVITVSIVAVLFCTYLAGVGILRYVTYSGSTFDLGIFGQLFHYMKTTGLPLTTCERDQLLSHFAVHLSPILYLLLPGYFLFPSPAYLQAAQAVIVVSGVIPLFLLSRHFGHGNKATLAVSLVYLFFPALTGGCNYDFHENCFMAPLLLWLLYFLETDKPIGIYVAAILTLAVKEDAAIFVACIAIYGFFYLGRKLHGGILFGLAIGYFALSMWILSFTEEGNFLSWRYSNFITDDSQGFFTIIKTIFLNPAYMLEQVFKDEEGRKIEFFCEMFLPLGLLPFFKKKIGPLILLVPMLLLSFITNYEYQYSINFQYVFGAIPMLFYLTVTNLRDFRPKIRKTLVPIMLASTAIIFSATQSFTTMYFTNYIENHNEIEKKDACIALVPDDPDVSVSASAFLMPHFSNHNEVFDPSKFICTDYVVLDLRPGVENITVNDFNTYNLMGYETVFYEENFMAVLHLTEQPITTEE